MRTRVHENQLTGTVTIEADSPTEALAAATSRFGAEAHIEAAQRVSRGGVGGFFAKERFQVRARAEAPPEGTASPWNEETPFDIEETPLFEAAPTPTVTLEPEVVVDVTDSATSFGSALEAALYAEDVSNDELEEEVVLADLTRENEPAVEVEPPRVDDTEILARVAREDQIRAAALAATQETPAATPAAVQEPPKPTRSVSVATVAAPSEVVNVEPPPPPAPPPTDEASSNDAPAWRLRGPAEPVAPGLGRVDWGKASLMRLGLPTNLIEAVGDVDIRDDLGWINTIADVVAPLCRSLPPGPVVMVGSGVERMASTLGLSYLRPGDAVIPEGSFCTSVADKPAEIEWLNRVRGNRGLHLVVGSDAWMHLLVEDPAGVSFVTDRGVVDALYVALTLGVPLGYGTVDGNRKVSRVDAIDVALTVRRMVGRQ